MKKAAVWIGLAFLLNVAMLCGQCTDSSTYRYDSSAVTRPNGNEEDGYGQSEVFGNYRYYWQLYLDSTWSNNGVTLGQNAADTASAGTTVWRKYWTNLQSAGPGTYVLSNTHNAWNVRCSYWDNRTITGDQKTVVRPARPDYLAGHPTALMYLGSRVSLDGAYSAQTVFTPGAANGAPESPVYAVSAGGSKMSLSCTNCTNPTATAIAASAGCQVYDVVVNTNYNGFLSDPFYLFINRPWNLEASTDDHDPGVSDPNHSWVYTIPWHNGYWTYVNYQTFGMCALSGPLDSYHLHEEWGGSSMVPDYSSENWVSTPPIAGNAYVDPGTEPGAPTWWDVDAQSNTTGIPGSPAWCLGGTTLCNPPWTNPSVGPHTLVEHIPQSWFIGSPTAGFGLRVQTDVLQYYTNSAWHTAIVTPNP